MCWEELAEPQGGFLQQRHPLIPKGGTALQVLWETWADCSLCKIWQPGDASCGGVCCPLASGTLLWYLTWAPLKGK